MARSKSLTTTSARSNKVKIFCEHLETKKGNAKTTEAPNNSVVENTKFVQVAFYVLFVLFSSIKLTPTCVFCLQLVPLQNGLSKWDIPQSCK